MFKTKEINNHIVVSLVNQKRLNIVIAKKVQKYLTKIVTYPNQKLVLNLENISFIDSEGFEMLTSILKLAENTNNTFELCNVSDEVRELFELKDLTDNFNVVDSYQFTETALV